MTDTPAAKDRGGDRSVTGTVAGNASARRRLMTGIGRVVASTLRISARAFRHSPALFVCHLSCRLRRHVCCYWILHVTLLE